MFLECVPYQTIISDLKEMLQPSIWDKLTAIGTLSAVVVSLFLAFRKKPLYITSKYNISDNGNIQFQIQNQTFNVPITIKTVQLPEPFKLEDNVNRGIDGFSLNPKEVSNTNYKIIMLEEDVVKTISLSDFITKASLSLPPDLTIETNCGNSVIKPSYDLKKKWKKLYSS